MAQALIQPERATPVPAFLKGNNIEILSIISSLVSVFTSGFCVCVLVFCIAFIHAQKDDMKEKHGDGSTSKGGGKHGNSHQGTQH